MDHKADIKKDMKMKEFCRVLKSIFEQVVMLEKYPRSQIDLQVFVPTHVRKCSNLQPKMPSNQQNLANGQTCLLSNVLASKTGRP